MQELAGVIAHEMRHVRQGWSRRFVVFVIAVHRWFFDVIDDAGGQSDAAVADGAVSRGGTTGGTTGAAGGIIDIVRALALFVGLRVLGLCLALARLLVDVLARQMELDADRAEAAVAGAETFAHTDEKLHAADLALGKTLRRAFVRGGNLPDNLPRWAALSVAAMPRSERRRAARVLTRDAVGVPHPPHDERVENARRTRAPGVPLPQHVPGSALMRSFDAYAMCATRDAVVSLLRGSARLISVEEYAAQALALDAPRAPGARRS